jgi:hypothetical protein
MPTQYFDTDPTHVLVYFGCLFNPFVRSCAGDLEDGTLPAEWTLPMVSCGLVRARRVTPLQDMRHGGKMSLGEYVYCTETGMKMTREFATWVNGLPYMPALAPDPNLTDSNPDRSL